MKTLFSFILVLFVWSAQAQLPTSFDPNTQPDAPNYSNPDHWLSLPFRIDGADVVVKGEMAISDSTKQADVFYIYPTLYGKGKTWTASIHDKKLNKRLEKYPVKYQASLFNQIARIYTPLYRQAIIKSFYDTTQKGEAALNFAYQDVKRAFEYYLKNYNQGRPIILVSHSQGTRHARQLIQDFFDEPKLKQQLVCAYIVGFGIYPKNYTLLEPCTHPTDTQCYVTWSSFKMGYTPEATSMLVGDVCINPIAWTKDTTSIQSATGILLNTAPKKRYENVAQLHQHYLWVKSKAPFIRERNVLHLVDFNLFWYSIRQNAKDRLNAFLRGVQ